MDLLTSQLTKLGNAVNDLKEKLLTNLDETKRIREILEQCPICELNEDGEVLSYSITDPGSRPTVRVDDIFYEKMFCHVGKFLNY